MNIRQASLCDIKDICEIHWSQEDFHASSFWALNEEDLKNRWLSGGVWMSGETCAIHLNHLLCQGHFPVVLEREGKVVAEAEFLVSHEKEGGKIFHLSLLYVHKNWQKKGLGHALLEYGKNLARNLGCEFLTTQPEKDAFSFYKKEGFLPWKEMIEIQLKVLKKESHDYIVIDEAAYLHDKKNWPMRLGRYQCEVQDSWKLLKTLKVEPFFSMEKYIFKHKQKPLMIGMRRQLFDFSQADVLAWAPFLISHEEILEGAQILGGFLGFKAIDTLIENLLCKDLKVPYEIQSKEELWFFKI